MGDALPDVQNSTEGFPRRQINKVGMRHVVLPIDLYSRAAGGRIRPLVDFSSYCDLVESIKGINMSRIARTIIDTVHYYKGEAPAEHWPRSMPALLTDCAKALQEAHNTDHIYIKARYDVPFWKVTPKSDLLSPELVHVTVEVKRFAAVTRVFTTVKTSEMSVCPCSKEMSLLVNNLTVAEFEWLHSLPRRRRLSEDGAMPESLEAKIRQAGFGAHAQKSDIEITVENMQEGHRTAGDYELVEIAKGAASCPTWTVLKRADEKYVTEVAYLGGYYESGEFYRTGGGPRFVEDIARHAAETLDKEYLDNGICDYAVVVNNQESIHSDAVVATAVLTAGRELT